MIDFFKFGNGFAIFSFLFPFLGQYFLSEKNLNIGLYISVLVLICGIYTLANSIFFLTVPDIERVVDTNSKHWKYYLIIFLAKYWEFFGIFFSLIFIAIAVSKLFFKNINVNN